MTTQSRSISIRLALSCKLQLGGSLPFGGSTSPAIARVARGRRSAYCVGNVWPAKPTQSIGHADLMTRWAAKISRQPQEFSEREKNELDRWKPSLFFCSVVFCLGIFDGMCLCGQNKKDKSLLCFFFWNFWRTINKHIPFRHSNFSKQNQNTVETNIKIKNGIKLVASIFSWLFTLHLPSNCSQNRPPFGACLPPGAMEPPEATLLQNIKRRQEAEDLQTVVLKPGVGRFSMYGFLTGVIKWDNFFKGRSKTAHLRSFPLFLVYYLDWYYNDPCLSYTGGHGKSFLQRCSWPKELWHLWPLCF